MRVGIVTPRYPPAVAGGGEISVKLLADQLSNRVEAVEVFSFDGGNESLVDDIPVHRFRCPPHAIMEVANAYALYALWNVRDVLSSFDVVHAYNVTLHPAVGTISTKLDLPSVATLNSYDILPKEAFGVTADLPRHLYEQLAMPTTGRILRHEVKKMTRFITLSEASRDIYRENGFGSVPIDVVPNMLDPSFTVPDTGASSEYYELLYVGSLIKEKGVSYLIRAMTHLPTDVRLLVVGSGDRAETLQALADRLNVSSRIKFTGQIPYEELRGYYGSADLFVHPGVWPEPFGRTVLEAMQAGLPVVATDIGGPAGVVPQQELLAEPRNEVALANAIQSARNRTQIGEENYEYVNERFAPEVIVQEILDVYAETINQF